MKINKFIFVAFTSLTFHVKHAQGDQAKMCTFFLIEDNSTTKLKFHIYLGTAGCRPMVKPEAKHEPSVVKIFCFL